MRVLIGRLCAVLTLVTAPAFGQHGMDFLIVTTPLLPEVGQGYAYLRHDYLSQARSETRGEPGLLFGLSDWAAIELEGRFVKPARRSITYASTAAALHLGFMPRGDAFSFGVSARYEVAHGEHGEERGDAWLGTLSAGYELGRVLTSLNLIYHDVAAPSPEWLYAAGVRVELTRRHAAGLEVSGSLHRDTAAEALLGYYGAFSPQFTLNVGFGTGIEQGPDWTARTAFIFRFR